MRQPKFNFIPERQLSENHSESGFFTASVGPLGAISFNAEYKVVYEIDQKYITFYADTQKRTLGWKIIEGKTELIELNQARQIIDKPSLSISIVPLLRTLGWQKEEKHLKLPISVYKNKDVEGEIHYVQLPDKFLKKE
jgi:hypothetical protein